MNCLAKIVGVQKQLRALLLLAVLLGQSMVMLSSWPVAQRASELEHLIVHFQDTNHHHHADSALHMDDDGGAVKHMHPDSGASSAGLLTSPQPALGNARSLSPPEFNLSIWLSATLEGPLKPPKQRA